MTATPLHTIALFGGTGKTGRHVLEQAIAAGHTVRMLARSPEAVTAASDRLTIIPGDVLDATAVDRVIDGADVVVSVFGQVKGSPPTLQTDGTRNIVAAMKNRGQTRLITLSGGALPSEHDRPKFADNVFRVLIRLISPQVLADAAGHLEVLQASGLDWTVVRGPRLTDSPAAGAYRVGWAGVNTSTQIPRADLATFILTQLDDTEFVHELPFVTT
jgi:putative NADH-flavin reductase